MASKPFPYAANPQAPGRDQRGAQEGLQHLLWANARPFVRVTERGGPERGYQGSDQPVRTYVAGLRAGTVEPARRRLPPPAHARSLNGSCCPAVP
ncbi:hypothetical protein [Streptomyces sp. WM6378]|uniref:hypothetical protein n=1 Tax=Streptomyces sp. WM6378 TaxID=1415557 RepID=UPI00131C7038|nr:hypothetical protein [Streptomyces sp. WM6378]